MPARHVIISSEANFYKPSFLFMSARTIGIRTMNPATLLRTFFLFTLAAAATLVLQAQTPIQATILRPPAGAKVALVEFADLECPDCARAATLLDEAEKTYKIPVVVYDFPLPQHAWAFDASVFAQYFRTKSPALEWK